MKRWRLIRLAVTFACVAALVAAANASAALVTLGSSFDGPPAGVLGCGGGCTLAQIAVQSPSTAVSPVDGVVVSFSLSKASKLPGYALQVLTPSGTSGTVTATSA